MSDLQNWMIAKPKSNSNCTEWFVKNKAANAPITFEEIVMVMIKSHYTSAKISHTKGTHVHVHGDQKVSSQQPTNTNTWEIIILLIMSWEFKIAILNTHKHELMKKLSYFNI